MIGVVNFIHVQVKFLDNLPVKSLESHSVSVAAKAELLILLKNLSKIISTLFGLLLLFFLLLKNLSSGNSCEALSSLNILRFRFLRKGCIQEGLLIALRLSQKALSESLFVLLLDLAFVIIVVIETKFANVQEKIQWNV